MTRPVDNPPVLGYSEKSLGALERPQVEPTNLDGFETWPPQDVTLWGPLFGLSNGAAYRKRRTIQ